MKDEMNDYLVEYLKGMMEALKDGASMLSEQIPPTIQEWIQYAAFKHLFLAILGLAVILVILLIAKYVLRKIKREEWDEDSLIPLWVFGTTFMLLSFALLIYSTQNAVKAMFFPRAYIFDYIMNLIN